MYYDERDLRQGLFHDPYVRGFDTSFWKGDTANLTFDTVKNRVKIGDTTVGAVGSISSYSQYLFGDFEFSIAVDSLSPDSNDSEKYFGLRNAGDTLRRGAAYFDMSYDTTAGDSSISSRSFAAVVYDEAGNRQRKFITWDTTWGGLGAAAPARFRIRWEADGYTFLVNDTVVATLGDRDTSQQATYQVNTTIPQAVRISNRTVDATDTSPMSLQFLLIRNARMIHERKML